MTVQILESAADRSEARLKAILAAQARVRVGAALPVIAGNLVYFMLSGALPAWFFPLTVAYCLYALSPYWFLRGTRYALLERLLVATAILDPVFLSGFIVGMGEYGSLIVCFFLFSILGYGFRTGRPMMFLCQFVSLAGFALVLAFNEYWRQHVVVWGALQITLLVVPFYAGVVIRDLQKARELAERQSRAKSDLLAKVSHELRTPLTGIIAATELLANESKEAFVARRTETILQLSNTLLDEINDLLDEAKYESNTFAIEAAPLDLAQHFGALRATFEPLATRKGVSFRTHVDAAIVDAVVADARHLERVLTNLAANAVKFTERGVIDVGADLLAATPSAYTVRFSVTDTGIGIPPAFRERIFQPFAQAEEGTHRRFGGTGLGLALSKKIVAFLGGDLSYESTVGAGTRFWFDLSLPRSAVSEAEAARAHDPVVAPKRILVVEDNATNQLLIQELLRVDGHDVVACGSGIEALELLAERSFDLLLLDYNLGDMDGVRVLQTYHFGRTNPAPAIFLTADATAHTATRLRNVGGKGILYKPISLSSLRRALAAIEFPETTQSEPDATAAVVAAPPRNARPALKVITANPLDTSIIEELAELHRSPEFLPTLLEQATSDITRSSDQLLDALSARQYQTVPNTAHALKGVCANVGAVRLGALASSLMSMPSDDIDAGNERLQQDLRDAFRSTVAALRELAARTRGSAGSGGASALQLD